MSGRSLDDTVQGPGYRLGWVGAQHRVLAGDLTPSADLRHLAALRHVNAVGPLAGLRGEVTVIDGVALISTLAAGTVRTDQSFEHHACFLVYAEVPRWRWIAQRQPLPTWPTLESLLRRVAEDAGISPDRPFPFRLVGHAESGILHVLDKQDDQRHSPERHEQVKVRFTLADEEVDVIGFYSTQHEGIFVPRGSPIHAHLAARGRTIAGHLDALRLGVRWQLGLPSDEPEETRL